MSLRRDLREVWTLGGMSLATMVRRVVAEFTEDEIAGRAAQLAYYFLFALFPFFIFLAALLAYVPIPNLMERIMGTVGRVAPGATSEIIEQNIGRLLTQPRGGLLSFGILVSLWVSSSAIVAIGESLNRAYGVREERPFWKVRGIAILLTIGLATLVIVSTALLIFGPELGEWLANRFRAGPAFDLVWSALRWPVAISLMIVAAALIYYFTPDVEQEWRWITPGSVFAVLTWLAMTLGFGYYVDHFGQYDKTYGSLGAVVVLLTWMYMSGMALLIGGEINAEIEHAAEGGKNAGEKELPK